MTVNVIIKAFPHCKCRLFLFGCTITVMPLMKEKMYPKLHAASILTEFGMPFV